MPRPRDDIGIRPTGLLVLNQKRGDRKKVSRFTHTLESLNTGRKERLIPLSICGRLFRLEMMSENEPYTQAHAMDGNVRRRRPSAFETAA